MKIKADWKSFIFIVLSLILMSTGLTFAQQTIVNVPSSDILDKGKIYVEFDAAFKFDNNPNNYVRKFSSFVPRVVAGVGKNMEVGVNLVGNIQPGAEATTIVPNIKIRLVNKENWSIVAGDSVYIPVRNKSYNIGNYVYVQASRNLKPNTRLTVGAYHASKNVFAAKAQRAGGQFAVEHTINSKFSVGGDWITGKHAGGYFTPVFTIRPVKRTSLYLGYSIGNINVSRGNHFFYAAVGINLN